jgi:hypothetical protein
MNRKTLSASLAGIITRALWRRPTRTAVRLLAAATVAVAAIASSPTVGHAQWWKEIDGCLAFEHRDYSGAQFAVDAEYTYNYVGDRWNDRISSVRCEVFCSLTVWEHRDYGGATRIFGDDTRYVGGSWIDRISSMEANCEE